MLNETAHWNPNLCTYLQFVYLMSEFTFLDYPGLLVVIFICYFYMAIFSVSKILSRFSLVYWKGYFLGLQLS